MVRIPYGRLELRLPDGGCNPYLTTAAVIAAGLDGVKRELHPGDQPDRDRALGPGDDCRAVVHDQSVGSDVSFCARAVEPFAWSGD